MDVKKCVNCETERPLTEFYLRDGRITHSWCKECNKAHALQRQRELKRQCVEYKGGVCEDCGREGHQAIFDFHHLDPSVKDFSFGSLRITKMNDVIKAELDKCVLLCACCHRLRHYDAGIA